MTDTELAATLEVDIEYDATPPKVLQLLNDLAGRVSKFRADEPNDYLQVGPTITWSTDNHRSRWKATTSLYRNATSLASDGGQHAADTNPPPAAVDHSITPASEPPHALEKPLSTSTDAGRPALPTICEESGDPPVSGPRVLPRRSTDGQVPTEEVRQQAAVGSTQP